MTAPWEPWEQVASSEALVQQTAQRLREVLKGMAQALHPFPRFLQMPTIQAVEVEPPGRPLDPERGCVVVLPDGELYELSLRFVPAPLEVGGIDQVEQFTPLDLPPAEYIVYALSAIRALARHLEQRP